MLKMLLQELLTSYVTKEKKSTRHYFFGFFALGGLLLLLVADFSYFHHDTAYLGSLLISATLFASIALILKVVGFYLHKRVQQSPLPSIIIETLPIIVRMLPASVISFIIWEIVRAKLLGKLRQLTKN